ncbi:MAG: polysaccharide deacetylase family protein [Deltaproteobacteria bacterium]|nr:polysaccharide deacetylase family protein [Deltaproteobacteria bacterium]
MTLKKSNETCRPPAFLFPELKPFLFFFSFFIFLCASTQASANTNKPSLAEYPLECPAGAAVRFYARSFDAVNCGRGGSAEKPPVVEIGHWAAPLVDTAGIHNPHPALPRKEGGEKAWLIERKGIESGFLSQETFAFELPDFARRRFMSLQTKEKIRLEERPIIVADNVIPDFTPPDITRVSTDEKLLAITFDGGAEDDDAPEILDALTERGIKATVFLTGEFIRKHPDTVRRIVADGHEVGNHTMNHPHLTDFNASYRHRTLPGVDKDRIGRELKGPALLFKQATGKEMSPLWRAPYGEMNADIRRWAFEEGYVHIGWTYDNKRKESLDTLDWVSDRTSPLYRSSFEIKRRILNFGGNENGARGGIVLMHLGTERKRDKASAVLGEILDALIERGYRFVTVSELLGNHKTLEAVNKLRKEKVMRGMVRKTEEGEKVRE